MSEQVSPQASVSIYLQTVTITARAGVSVLSSSGSSSEKTTYFPRFIFFSWNMNRNGTYWHTLSRVFNHKNVLYVSRPTDFSSPAFYQVKICLKLFIMYWDAFTSSQFQRTQWLFTFTHEYKSIDMDYEYRLTFIKNLFKKDEKCSIWQAQLIFKCSLIMNISTIKSYLWVKYGFLY